MTTYATSSVLDLENIAAGTKLGVTRSSSTGCYAINFPSEAEVKDYIILDSDLKHTVRQGTSLYMENHTMVAATCTTPRSCSGCDLTIGQPLGHDTEDSAYEWSDGVLSLLCSRCGDPTEQYTAVQFDAAQKELTLTGPAPAGSRFLAASYCRKNAGLVMTEAHFAAAGEAIRFAAADEVKLFVLSRDWKPLATVWSWTAQP